MGVTLRPMSSADVATVEEIDGTAFSELLSSLTHRRVELPSHEREYFEFWRSSDPEGSLVEEQDGRVNGFIFCHARGHTGWIGPLAVRVGEQGRGIGKRLLSAGLMYLNERNTQIVGLDTFTQNPVSVSLYLKHGFKAMGAVLLMGLRFDECKPRPVLESRPIIANDLPRIAALEEKQSRSNRLPDYKFILRSNLGRGFVIEQGRDVKSFCFCIIRRRAAFISNFYLSAGCDSKAHLSGLLAQCISHLSSAGYQTATVLCRGSELRLFDGLLQFGARLSSAMLTMHRGKGPVSISAPVSSPLAVEKG